MEDQLKKKKDPTVMVRTPEGTKEYPASPGFMDYAKEAFEPTETRAQIDAVRRRREKYGS